MQSSIIQTQNLSIGYYRQKKPWVVQSELNLNVDQKELVCLIGPNGCGKSTLLRSLAGLQPILKGNIFINGLPLSKQSLREKARLLALVLTDKVEINALTVYGLVAMGRNPYTSWVGNLSEGDKRKVKEALAQVHLQEYENRFISELSDGEKQRAMIAKALVQETPVIFLDEPTAHLDLPNRVEVMLLLRKLAKETNKAVILSTHELDLALQGGDKLWLMSPREGIMVGTPEDLILNNRIQAVFANKAFSFDNSTGNFIMNHSGSQAVSIETVGEGIRTYWTKRALIRQEYLITSNAPITIKVYESENKWEICASGRKKTAISLEELLSSLDCLNTQALC